MRVHLWSVLVLCVCEPACAQSPPTTPSRGTPLPSTTPTEDESAQLVDWLSKYGYLPPPDASTGQLQTWSAVTQAVKAMQKFAGLEETGIADDETLRLMQTPRCSLPDEDRAANQPSGIHDKGRNHRIKRAAASWARRNINWWLSSYPRSSGLSRETVRSLVFYALRVWAEPTSLEFHEVGGPEVADLQVDFLHGPHGDGYPFDGTGGAVGHAFYPSDPNRAGGVHLDAEEEWAFRQPASEGTDLFTVLIHELGHALGLSHSSARRSVMRPYYQGPLGDPLHFKLGAPDLEQITALYGKRSNELPPDSTSQARAPLLRHPNKHTHGHTHHHTHGHWHSHSHDIDRCNTSFDAVAKIRGEIFFFKGLSMWRVSRGGLVSGRAVSVRRLWGALPPTLTSVNAVLERHSDHAILFISDSQVWLFKELSLQEGYPRPVSNLTSSGGASAGGQGLLWHPEEGAVWGAVPGETEQETGRGGGEKKESEIWTELIRGGVNGIITEDDGSTYLFKGNSYWKFTHPASAPEAGYPRSLATDWLDCPASFSHNQDDLSLTLPGDRQEFREQQGESGASEDDRDSADQIRLRGRHRHMGGHTDSDLTRDSPLYWTCPCLSRAPGGSTLQVTSQGLVWLLCIFTLAQ
ncbi:matrix metalloproteinase-17b [Clupea harengus]|uniref:Matrix metalloproteinase-17b n=1 Tax=Clupea harengus TaxID=7950 RepID=A0A6P8H673_CLUHA|nr:matrix metalloproteinase-17b [Clupea harengus]